MKFISFLSITLFLCCRVTAQTGSLDSGIPDTISLSPTLAVSNQSDTVLEIQVWVFSDEPIISFLCEFEWDNSDFVLDSARRSDLIASRDFSIFFYYQDDWQSSNINRKFQLSGFTVGDPITGDATSRRLWATYYFSKDNFRSSDSITIDVTKDSSASLEFVSMGPYYPYSFEPVFSGPLLFPEISTDIIENGDILPTHFELFQNYPNPFNPNTTIEFELEQSSIIDLSVFNVLGQKVSSLYSGRLPAGLHRFQWNGTNQSGIELSSGIYLYRLETGDLTQSKKMLLLR